ncbi:MAG: cell division protein ZipA C-terminal FtsZ-binding domain-containing protein [Steroidobacteraceae bacterium]
MDDLRWALALVGLLFVGGLAWWEMRKPRQGGAGSDDATPEVDSPGHRREPHFDESPDSTLGSDSYPSMRAQDVGADPPVLVMEARRDSPGTLDLAIAADVAVDEPGSAGSLRVEPESVDVPPFEVRSEAALVEETGLDESGAEGPVVEPEAPPSAASPTKEPQWPAEDQRRIVSLRLVPRPPARFSGRTLRQAFESSGLEFGSFDIYHLMNESGEVFASAANLMRPGTFAPATMDGQHFHGVHLFCVLPGPLPAGRAVDELVALGRDLAQRLQGLVLDEVGQPLDEERAAALRESAEQAARGQ